MQELETQKSIAKHLQESKQQLIEQQIISQNNSARLLLSSRPPIPSAVPSSQFDHNQAKINYLNMQASLDSVRHMKNEE